MVVILFCFSFQSANASNPKKNRITRKEKFKNSKELKRLIPGGLTADEITKSKKISLGLAPQNSYDPTKRNRLSSLTQKGLNKELSASIEKKYEFMLPFYLNQIVYTDNSLLEIDSAWNPLYRAITSQLSLDAKKITIKRLLEKGAWIFIDKNNDQALTPLMLAEQTKQFELKDLLLEYGLQHVILAKKKALVEWLLNQGAWVFLNKENQSQTPLMLAARTKQKDIEKLLIVSGLYHAISNKNLDFVKWLLENGGWRFVNRQIKGATPLMLAAKLNDIEMARLLSEYGAEHYIENKNNCSVLSYAIAYGNIEFVKWLLKKGAVWQGKELALAIGRDNLAIVRALIKYPNVLPDLDLLTEESRDKMGMPLSIIALNLATFNLTKKDIFISRIQFGIHYAAKHGNLAILEELLKHNLDVNVRNFKNMTALHWAAQECHWDIVKLLLKKGANPNIQNIRGRIPLHLAAQAMPQETVQLEKSLAKGVSDLSQKPLFEEHKEAQKACYATVLFLAQDAKSINAQDIKGMTPLHWAARSGQEQIAQLLQIRGANIELKDFKARTPLLIAKQQGHLQIVSLFESNSSASVYEKLDIDFYFSLLK